MGQLIFRSSEPYQTGAAKLLLYLTLSGMERLTFFLFLTLPGVGQLIICSLNTFRGETAKLPLFLILSGAGQLTFRFY